MSQLTDSLVERRWIDAGPQGLAGERIEFAGLQLTITDVLARFQMLDGRNWTTIVRPSQPWVEMAASQTWLETAGSYIMEGVRHILYGPDHLLFVLGLMLIVKGRWMLLKTVTAFTVAHSITLAIATFGYANVPALPAQCRDRAEHPVPGSGDRAHVARGDELHDPPSVGGGVRVRPAAWIRLRDAR